MAAEDRHTAPALGGRGMVRSDASPHSNTEVSQALDDIIWDGPPLPGTSAERRSYHLFHALRLLEQRMLRLMRQQSLELGLDPAKCGRALGDWGAAPEVPLRLRASTRLGHPATDLEEIEWREIIGADGQARRVVQISTHFLRLYGATSPLPRWFSVLMRRQADSPAREFIDIFHHRLLSLLYRSWKHHRYEYAFRDGGLDSLSRALLDMVGIDPQMSAEDLGMEPVRALRYLGLLLVRTRPAEGLLHLLREELQIPIKLRELPVRIWPLDASQQASCPHVTSDRSRGGRLGRDFVLGSTRADAMSGLGIDIGPVPYETFLRFRPGQPDHRRLIALIRLYLRQPLDVLLRVSVPAAEVAGLRLGHPREAQALGQAACLGTPPSDPVVFCLDSSLTHSPARTNLEDSSVDDFHRRRHTEEHVSR